MKLSAPALMLIAFVLFEGPVRMLTATDPWLVSGGHWYFVQPLRLFSEIAFVLTAGAVMWRTGLREVMFHPLKLEHIIYLVVAIGFIGTMFTLARGNQLGEFASTGLLGGAALWFITGIFIGIGQEMTFRGLLLSGLLAYFSKPWAWLLSVVIFTFAPLHSYRVGIYVMDGEPSRAITLTIIYAIAGVIFLFLRLRTKGLVVPALIHATVNALTFMFTFTAVAAAG